MRVFSVEMLVKEEGAAVVEAALKRLKGEAKAVAAEMKVTTSQVTTTGRAMQAAGEKTTIAGDRAAKAAIGFAAVGQSIARTGSLTADAGTRIIEAGSQIAMMFGPTGLVAGAILGIGIAIASRMRQTREEIEKTKASLDELADVGNVEALLKQRQQLAMGRPSQQYRDGIVGLARELTNLKDKYRGVIYGLENVEQLTRTQIRLNDNLDAQEKRDLLRMVEIVELMKQKQEQITNINTLLPIARSVQAENTKATESATAAERTHTAAIREGNTALDQAIRLNAQVRGAIQAREAAEARGLSTIGMTRFGTGLEAGSAERFRRPAAPLIDIAAIERDLLGATAEIAGIVAVADIDQQLFDAIKLDDIKNNLAVGIAGAVSGGLVSGLQAAIATGNIGDVFQAMGQAIISSLASSMVDVALAAIGFGKLLASIQTFMMAHPLLAVASAVALLALARSMGGSAKTAPMVATGGAGGLNFSAAGVSSGPTSQIIFGATSATTAAGMQPRSATNVTIIGPNDPSAQRAMQELLAKANSRGRVG